MLLLLAIFSLINILADIIRDQKALPSVCAYIPEALRCGAHDAYLCPSPTASTSLAWTLVIVPQAAYIQMNLQVSNDF